MYILAADDEQGALDELVYALEKVFPKAVIHVETKPLDALRWSEELTNKGEKLDYAFLDIRMGGMDGLELARRLKILQPDTMLVFYTAYNQYAIDAFGLFAKGYLMKPICADDITEMLDKMVVGWRDAATNLTKDIRVQTFGHFEVFVDGQRLAFEREKAKELLAYLVDRHGASVTTEQIAAVLWEDRNYDRSLKNQVTSTVASLKKTLQAVDSGHILVKTWNHLALDTEKVKCDAYDFEKGDMTAVNAFRGEYMINYSWAEFTAGRYVQVDLRQSSK